MRKIKINVLLFLLLIYAAGLQFAYIETFSSFLSPESLFSEQKSRASVGIEDLLFTKEPSEFIRPAENTLKHFSQDLAETIGKINFLKFGEYAAWEVDIGNMILVNLSDQPGTILFTKYLSDCTGIGIKAINRKGEAYIGCLHLLPIHESKKEFFAYLNELDSLLKAIGLKEISYSMTYDPDTMKIGLSDQTGKKAFEKDVRSILKNITFHERMIEQGLIALPEHMIVTSDEVYFVPINFGLPNFQDKNIANLLQQAA